MITAVRLAARGSGAPPELRDGRKVLRAELDWVVSGPPAALEAIRAALPPAMVERLGSQLLLSFGNAVGQLELPGVGAIELVTGKLGEGDFEAMLEDVSRSAAALPFDVRTGVGLPHERRLLPEQHVLFHAFVYLRHVTSDRAPRHERLPEVFESIARDPHFVLARCGRSVPVERAAAVGPGALAAIVEGRVPLVAVRRSLGAPDLVRNLRGHAPERVIETRAERVYDTAENRFVKHFLETCRDLVSRVRQHVADRRGAFDVRVRAECDRIGAVLDRFRADRLFDEVGPLVHLPAGSTVLHGRRGYRELYRHHVRMRLVSRIPLDAERTLHELIELKNIARLYEVWSFFQVVSALKAELGAPSHAGRAKTSLSHVHLPNELEVRWPSGIAAVYNPSFSKSRPKNRRSYSLPLRPDIALFLPRSGGPELHVLDAKFKLRSRAASGATAEDPTRAKPADVHKMHAYRDALGARTAVALYPGSHPDIYFDQSGGAVGALPLRPGSHGPALAEWLQKLLVCSRPYERRQAVKE